MNNEYSLFIMNIRYSSWIFKIDYEYSKMSLLSTFTCHNSYYKRPCFDLVSGCRLWRRPSWNCRWWTAVWCWSRGRRARISFSWRTSCPKGRPRRKRFARLSKGGFPSTWFRHISSSSSSKYFTWYLKVKLTLNLLVTNSTNTKNVKNLENDWNPGKWVLI